MVEHIGNHGKSQQTMTLNTKLLETVYGLKESGKVPSVSDFFDQAGWDFIEKTRVVTKSTVVIFIVYPWLISIIFLLWSQNASSLSLAIFVFYVNLIVFGLTIASTYWFYRKWKDE